MQHKEYRFTYEEYASDAELELEDRQLPIFGWALPPG
jgi:hypothetical protein